MDKVKDIAEMLDENVPVSQEQETSKEEVNEETSNTEAAQTGEQPTETPAVKDETLDEKKEVKYVPYERFQEINNEMKELRAMNQRLQYIIEDKLKPQAPEPDETAETIYDPVVKKVYEENKQLRQYMAQVVDKQDLIDAKMSIKDYGKFANDVEVIRRDFLRRGQVIPRADIYTYLQGQRALKSTPAQVNVTAQRKVEPEPQKPIPESKPAARNNPVQKKPQTLDEQREALKDIVF